MGYNVAEIAENFITKDIVSKASGFLDESESSISKAVSVIIPIIVAKVADKSTSTYGATLVAQMATEQHNSGICVDINNFFGQEGGRFLNKGASLYNGLFGQSTDKLTDTVSNFAAVKPATTISLMSMGVPLILGIIGKKAAAENLPAGEIASFISSQKNEIMSAIPSGINLNGVFDGNNQLINTLAASKKSNIMTSHQVEETNTQETDNGLRWLLPILLLIFLAALCWYFMGKAPAHTEEAMAEHTEHGAKPAEEHAEVMAAAGKVDSLQNFVYELGKMVTIELPNNAGKLEVGEYSTENKLFKFLSDKDAKLDSVKGNWFEFTNVRFKTGGTQIDSSSLVQLKNMVMFCKGFPAAQFKVGGYTDNSGDSAKNVILSEKRANAVLAEIIKQGAAATSFTGAKGYGPEHPIGDNATAEGKAMNRRVAVNVKAK